MAFTIAHAQMQCSCTQLYLVRHGGGAHFVFLDGLGEVIEAHVGPHVAAEVNDNRVDPSHAVAVRGDVVVVRDLM